MIQQVECEIDIMRCEEVMMHWPQIAEELEKVEHVWGRWWTLESLQQGILEGSVQVWGVGCNKRIHMFVFSTIVNYPANRILRIFLGFGNALDALLPIIVDTLYRFGL